MTRETWMRDLRIVDDIVIRTGEVSVGWWENEEETK